jgi:hypothetical protein
MPKPLPVIVGSQAVSVFAMRDGWVRWKITAPGPMPERGIVLWLDPFDIVSLGKRSVAAIKAAQR